MKKRIFLMLMFAMVSTALIMFSGSCTENQRAKQFGGTASIELPANQKLITATWKDDNLWLLTRTMRSDETVENYVFTEESSFGVWEGSYIIKERR